MKMAYIGLKGLPSKGGGERVAEAIVRRLATRHEFTVYCDENYTPSDAVIPRVRLLRLPTLRGKHTRMFILDLLAALHAVIFGDYDLIHVHNCETGFIIPLLRLRYKVVGTSHSRAYTAEKWGLIARLFMRLAEILFVYLSHAITCVTPVLKPYYDQFGSTHYIPNGVDLNRPVAVEPAIEILRKHQVSPERYVLFAAGRIIPLKGCHFLLEAFRRIETECELAVVGDLEQMPEYGAQLRQMANSQVHFIPFVSSPAEVAGLVQQARLFVFPSTNEAMSLMLLEVASLGTPLLCSDIPQNVAVLGDHGFYFKSGDIDDLAMKLQWALANPLKLQQLAKQAQAHVLQHFGWEQIAEQYDAVYNQVV